MPSDLQFKRLSETPSERLVTIHFSGQRVQARSGDTVAAALLGAGHRQTRRTPVSGVRRGPYCLMGVCYECLVEVNGTPNRQGCMVIVEEGMRVEPMHGARGVIAESKSGG